MISQFVTILIPCKDSLSGIKTSIESIQEQFKIHNTKVFILDYGSRDGSIQYVSDLIIKSRNRILVEVIDMGDERIDFRECINSPYILWMSPGSELKAKDFIFNSINSVTNNKDLYIYPYNNSSWKTLFSGYNIKKGLLKSIIFSKKSTIDDIKYIKEGSSYNFRITKALLNKSKIIR